MSPKTNTTVHCRLGVFNEGDAQIALYDTPGLVEPQCVGRRRKRTKRAGVRHGEAFACHGRSPTVGRFVAGDTVRAIWRQEASSFRLMPSSPCWVWPMLGTALRARAHPSPPRFAHIATFRSVALHFAANSATPNTERAFALRGVPRATATCCFSSWMPTGRCVFRDCSFDVSSAPSLRHSLSLLQSWSKTDRVSPFSPSLFGSKINKSDPRLLRLISSLNESKTGSDDWSLPPSVLVLNKLDALKAQDLPKVEKLEREILSLFKFDETFWISALKGAPAEA